MKQVLPDNNNPNNARERRVKILVVTGASGGHIFPALSFLDALKEQNKGIDALFVLPLRNAIAEIPLNKYKVKYLSISAVRLCFDFDNLLSILRFFKAALESFFLLLEFRPDVVVGFGSINSIPLVLWAWMHRTKTLIHEQNVIPGRANKLLAKFVDKAAISFIETKHYLKISQDKITLTGNPLRRELKPIERHEALRFFGFTEDKFTFLVMGGSQGSQRINAAFLRGVSAMPDTSRLQIIHIAGDKDFSALSDSYKKLDVNFRVCNFLKEMEYAYSLSNLAIVRAGATTIAELMFFRLPAIIIPYPFAYEHQSANAGVLEKMGAAIIVRDDDLDADKLSQVLVDLVNNPDKINTMRNLYSNVDIPLASKLLAEQAFSLAKS